MRPMPEKYWSSVANRIRPLSASLSVLVSGAAGTSGIALVEVYEIP